MSNCVSLKVHCQQNNRSFGNMERVVWRLEVIISFEEKDRLATKKVITFSGKKVKLSY